MVEGFKRCLKISRSVDKKKASKFLAPSNRNYEVNNSIENNY